jgi:quercetin dioxygenase-like cupin family protein
LKHNFAEGVYVREIFIPKGSLIVGKIHKHSHPNFLMKGEVSVLTEEGPKRLKAPLSMISPAGTKRVVYAHEDTVWITVHVTKKTNLKKIEKDIIAKTYAELPDADKEVLRFLNQVKEK